MDQVAQIRDKIDIVALITEYIPLKKTGRNFTACCPFHKEKTPSFVVSPERQIWHCFGGCNKGGDAFSFLMEFEKMDFPEALSILAKKAGVELVRSQFAQGASAHKEKLYELNHLSCEFYHYVLTNHAVGKKALGYLLKERRLTPSLIKTFMIGFSPRLGNPLSEYLVKKKSYQRQDIFDAGLATIKGGTLVDFFKGRVMFPLIDHRGNVVGFSGRVFEDGDRGPKYINTKDTLIYHKGSHFFGIHGAKEAIKKENRAIIVEGEFDVISCFKEGVGNAIAVKGTALTVEQIALLCRFAQKVSLCFDTDAAGQEAIKRSLLACEEKGMSVGVVAIPIGKDADEAIKKDPAGFKKAVKHDIPVYDFFFEKLLTHSDTDSVDSAEGKKKIASELIPLIAHISNAIVKEHYVRKLSKELATSYESIMQELDRMTKKDTSFLAPSLSKTKRAREEVLEEYLTALILQCPHPLELMEFVEWEDLVRHATQESAYQKITRFLKDFLSSGHAYQGALFARILPKELHSAFDTCFLFPLPSFVSEEAYRFEGKRTKEDLKTLYVKEAIALISARIKKEEKTGAVDEGLQKQMRELTSFLKK